MVWFVDFEAFEGVEELWRGLVFFIFELNEYEGL